MKKQPTSRSSRLFILIPIAVASLALLIIGVSLIRTRVALRKTAQAVDAAQDEVRALQETIDSNGYIEAPQSH